MIPINPPASLFGTVNAVLAGKARRYASRFTGPLSVKAVIEGAAAWETDAGRFEVVAGSALILNDGETYEIEVDALQPVETFCLFFARGFVEDVFRAATRGSAVLLDDPFAAAPVAFSERLHFDDGVSAAMSAAYHSLDDEAFAAVAEAMVRGHVALDARVASLPALRATTRAELARRLAIATSYLHANASRRVSVEEAASAACLSPFHFHRLFRALHGTTPHRYLARLRLERARALLARGVPVVEAALNCGFESVPSFTALFRKTFGATPGKFARTEKPRPSCPATMRA